MQELTFALGGDHAGYELKELVIAHLIDRGHIVIDHGPNGTDSVDYPDFVHPVCHDIIEEVADLGIVICGSGNGVAITANKYQQIRCGLCWTPQIAALTRQHNDANVIALPARFVDSDRAMEIIDAFIDSHFEGGRHQLRIDKIPVTC